MADHGRRRGSPEHAAVARTGARSRWSHLPDPIVDRADGTDPEHEALLADSVGLALLVVLETLAPAERLAFVLHDMFAVPFDEIAPIVDRRPRPPGSSPAAPVAGSGHGPRSPTPTWRGNARSSTRSWPPPASGDFDALVAVLDPDVVLQSRRRAGRPSAEVHGAETVAGQAQTWSRADLTVGQRASSTARLGVVTLQRRRSHGGRARSPSPERK